MEIDNKIIVGKSKSRIILELEALRQSPFKNIIFGVSGSVATIKANLIAKHFLQNNLNVIFLPT